MPRLVSYKRVYKDCVVVGNMPAKKINALPAHVVRQLCRYLNIDGSGVRNWKDLIAYAPGNLYSAIYDVAAFARAGQKLDSSPTEEVLTDFASLGLTVDDLYLILHRMDALLCMETIASHVSPEIIASVAKERDQQQSLSPNFHTPPSFDIDPEFGPLPPHPPPTTAQLRANNRSHDLANGSTRRSHDPQQSYSTNPSSRYRTSPDQSCDPLSPYPTTPSYSSNESSSGWSSTSTVLPYFTGTEPIDPVLTPDPSPQPAPTLSGRMTPNILHFTYSELSNETEDFTADIVGMGAFGTVFKANIRGNGPFAIKKLHNESEMGGGMFYDTIHRDSFAQELQLLTRYNHKNILSLVAYSNDGPMPCLVYEFMKHGSLAECLLGKRDIVLPWYLRLDIAKQVADALHFLHTVNKPTCLVHGDVKSANILLDAHLVPKLSDFGLARELKRGPNERSTYSTKSDVVMGTMAYMAPEFIRNKKFTPRTDVYSYGVVLLEMYTGQSALSSNTQEKNRVLTERFSRLIADSESHRDEVLRVADPRAKWPSENALELFDIATVCLVHIPKRRPGMDQVLTQLDAILPPLGAI